MRARKASFASRNCTPTHQPSPSRPVHTTRAAASKGGCTWAMRSWITLPTCSSSSETKESPPALTFTLSSLRAARPRSVRTSRGTPAVWRMKARCGLKRWRVLAGASVMAASESRGQGGACDTLQPRFPHVQGEAEGDAHQERRGHRCPHSPHPRAPALDRDERPQHCRGDEHVQGEEGAHPVGEELLDEEAEVEAMLHEEGEELRAREHRSGNTEQEIRVLRLRHAPPPGSETRPRTGHLPQVMRSVTKPK